MKVLALSDTHGNEDMVRRLADEAEKNDVPVHYIRMAHIIGRCT